VLRSIAPRTLLLALFALGLLAAPAAAVPTIDGEFKLATPIDTNTKIAAGPDGNIWVNLAGPEKDVARITPAGVVAEFELGVAGTSGVAAGSDGNVWVTSTNAVTKFAPADPEGTKVSTAIAGIEGNSPIVGGPDGNLWVATKDKVFKIPPANPAGNTPFTFTGLAPTDIDATNTELAIADTGTVKRILALSTAGAATGEFGVGGPPQGVAGNPDGHVAFTQPVNQPKEMGILGPSSAPLVVQISGGLDPFGLALGGDGAYWSAERNSNGLLRMTPAGEITPLTGFSAGSEPRQITAGPNNTLWVTLPGAGVNSVGRVSGVVAPVITPPATVPTTKLAKGPKGAVKTTKNRAKVSFQFSSTDPAATFQCRLVKLKKKGAKKSASSKKAPTFKACKSPRNYSLKPGKYRFEVRAVNAAGPDATPAKRGFRVVRVFAID
jgi:streptogramin lyase